jgi:hypothetical protein
MALTSMVQLPKNKYCKDYFPVEIIEMNDPVKVNSILTSEMKQLDLFKYTVMDAHGNRGELVSWGEAIPYKTGDRIYLRNFLVKEFKGIIQLVRIQTTEIKLIIER